jgi:hypothetical protein
MIMLRIGLTLIFLLNLLRKPSWFIYLATVILDTLLPKEANSTVILGYRNVVLTQNKWKLFFFNKHNSLFLSETDWLHW